MTKSRQDIEEEILPGIGLLSTTIRKQFMSTEEGDLFNQLVSEIITVRGTPVHLELGPAAIRYQNNLGHQNNIQSFLRRFQNSTTYGVLKQEIIKQKLIRFYSIFSSLSDNLQNVLANTSYSLALFDKRLEDEEAKENWLIDFTRDESPDILEIANQCYLDIIRHELSQCYPYYLSLTEGEQILIAKKSYSSIFLSYPLQLAKPFWLSAWMEDDSASACHIKENERLVKIKDKIKHFYPYYDYLNDSERYILIQKSYSSTILTREEWLRAFANDHSEDLVLIKEKEALRPIKDKISSYYPGYIYLDKTQRHQLATTWYSKKCLTPTMKKNDWLRALANDQHESILQIKQKIADEYQYHFGFLFKSGQSNWQEIISYMYAPDIQPEQKKSFLLHLLNRDWAYERPLWESVSYKIEASLNYFLQYPTEVAKKYVDDIANVHAFYRFFGMSSDNVVFGLQFEPGLNGVTPIVSLLDLYNYHKNRKSLSEALSIWQALRIPLNLFFDEYLEIGRFEKNPLNICLRAFVPFLVMAFFLTFGYSIVLPLATHVFLEYLLFIPSLYLSIAAASLYLHVRNETYAKLMTWWYDGYFNSPLFLANERLKMAFGEKDQCEDNVSLADCVAQYYSQKFKECEQIEEDFSKRKLSMDCNDLKNYQRYSKLKFELYLEWYDIHERVNVPIDQIPKIVHNRLKNERSELIKQIHLNNNDYISKYSNQCFTFFTDDHHKALREQCSLRNQRFVELESFTLKIDKQIKNLDDRLGTCNMTPLNGFGSPI